MVCRADRLSPGVRRPRYKSVSDVGQLHVRESEIDARVVVVRHPFHTFFHDRVSFESLEEILYCNSGRLGNQVKVLRRL
jgi:hypothetical protein